MKIPFLKSACPTKVWGLRVRLFGSRWTGVKWWDPLQNPDQNKSHPPTPAEWAGPLQWPLW